MARVVCSLPNAAPLINGVKFTPDRGQMISDEVSDEVAAAFAAIPGYDLAGAKKPAGAKGGKPDDTPPPPPPPAA